MELYLVRHALAEDRHEFFKKGLEDHLRPLTMKGRKRMLKIGSGFKKIIKDIDLIVTSPHTRAKQTALILSRFYKQTKIVESPELSPDCSVKHFLKWLRMHQGQYRRIIVVGHEPSLSLLAGYLLTGKEVSFLDIKKGGVVAVEFDLASTIHAGHSQLVFALPPRFFG